MENKASRHAVVAALTLTAMIIMATLALAMVYSYKNQHQSLTPIAAERTAAR